jgi:putative membrane protein
MKSTVVDYGQPGAETHFAWLRSRLSAERTLMSYARSSISCIGLGFVMYEYLTSNDVLRALVSSRGVTSPEWLGLGLMVAGVVLLAVGAWDYRSFVTDLRAQGYREISGTGGWRLGSGAPLMLSLLFLVAAFAFFAVLFNP